MTTGTDLPLKETITIKDQENKEVQIGDKTKDTIKDQANKEVQIRATIKEIITDQMATNSTQIMVMVDIIINSK